MLQIFKNSEQPFLLAILLGLLSFVASQITRNLIDSPTIQYSFSEVEQVNPSVKTYYCKLRNLSTDKSFNNLTFNFRNKGEHKPRIYDPVLIPVAPSALHDNDPEHRDSLLLIYTITQLQPGLEYKLQFKIRSNDGNFELPYIFLSTENSNQAIRLVEASLATWIVRNFLELNIVLLVILLVLFIFYILKLQKNNDVKNENTTQS